MCADNSDRLQKHTRTTDVFAYLLKWSLLRINEMASINKNNPGKAGT